MYNRKFNHCTHWMFLTTIGLSCNISLKAIAADATTDNATLLNPLETTTAEDVIRARILDSIPLVDYAKAEVAQVTTIAELTYIADNWNTQSNNQGANSKYVSSVQIAPYTGEITLTFNEQNVGSIPTGSTLVFTPYIQDGNAPQQFAAALASQVTGVMDWGCASMSNAVSSSVTKNLPALTLGTLPAKYAPWECR